MEIIREVEDNVVKDSLITDYDLQIIGESLDLDMYETTFDPEKSLYNLKKEIKVDRSDLGAKQYQGRKRDLKMKQEQGLTMKVK